jgi:hypothetical protein
VKLLASVTHAARTRGDAEPCFAVTDLRCKTVTALVREGGSNGGRAQRLLPSQAFWMHATRAAQNMACLRLRTRLITTSGRYSRAVPTSKAKTRSLRERGFNAFVPGLGTEAERLRKVQQEVKDSDAGKR